MEGLVEKYDALHGWTWKEGETPFSDRKYILAASVIYLVTIFALRYGTPRPIRLKWPMALHNLFLFILSLAMLLGVLSEAFFALRKGSSLFDLYCDVKGEFTHGRIAFWVWVFHISKIYEFLDTVFIALKHGNLEFLHVYHHVLTLWVTWVGIYTNTSFQWMGTATNTFVHCWMYFYYFVSTFGIHPWWKKYLTILQMVQFWFNTVVLVYWFVLKYFQNQPCIAESWSIALVLFANVTFFYLFQRFYKRTYKAKTNPVKKAN